MLCGSGPFLTEASAKRKFGFECAGRTLERPPPSGPPESNGLLPDMKKEDVNVELPDGTLAIEGERQQEKPQAHPGAERRTAERGGTWSWLSSRVSMGRCLTSGGGHGEPETHAVLGDQP